MINNWKSIKKYTLEVSATCRLVTLHLDYGCNMQAGDGVGGALSHFCGTMLHFRWGHTLNTLQNSHHWWEVFWRDCRAESNPWDAIDITCRRRHWDAEGWWLWRIPAGADPVHPTMSGDMGRRRKSKFEWDFWNTGWQFNRYFPPFPPFWTLFWAGSLYICMSFSRIPFWGFFGPLYIILNFPPELPLLSGDLQTLTLLIN